MDFFTFKCIIQAWLTFHAFLSSEQSDYEVAEVVRYHHLQTLPPSSQIRLEWLMWKIRRAWTHKSNQRHWKHWDDGLSSWYPSLIDTSFSCVPFLRFLPFPDWFPLSESAFSSFRYLDFFGSACLALRGRFGTSCGKTCFETFTSFSPDTPRYPPIPPDTLPRFCFKS